MKILQMTDYEAIMLEEIVIDSIDSDNHALKQDMDDKDRKGIREARLEKSVLLERITKLTPNQGG